MSTQEGKRIRQKEKSAMYQGLVSSHAQNLFSPRHDLSAAIPYANNQNRYCPPIERIES
jgi:hypothetical protein